MAKSHASAAAAPMPVSDEQRLTLLSANIQAGNATAKYRDYVTGSWNHVLPGWRKRSNLDVLADKASQFDIVGLQEADAPAALRLHEPDPLLAERAGFPYWSHQPNRRVAASRPVPTACCAVWNPMKW